MIQAPAGRDVCPPQAPPVPQGQNAQANQQQSSDAATSLQAGVNSHQDIYNLLSNLKSMASSMASSIVNQ